MISVALRFMDSYALPKPTARSKGSRRPRASWCSASSREGIRRRKPQRDTDADDERRVDQAEEQEDLRLQHVHELGLARRGFDVLAGHQADADARTQCADADDQSASQGDKSNISHEFSPEKDPNQNNEA